MTKTSPLVSIVVPAYNAERFLSEALTSVCVQTHDAIEVIVCDDASTDRTADIARDTGDPRVRSLRNDQTLGGYGAMNRAVRDSRGEFVAIYHADDVYDTRIVERELAFLVAHQDVGAVFCLDRFIDESGREYRRLEVPAELAGTTVFDASLLAENLLRYKNTFLRTPSVMFRRVAFDAVGGFDQERFGIAAVARVLALRTLVRAAAATGTSTNARRLVHFARFRRLPAGDLAPPSASAAHSLATPAMIDECAFTKR